MEGKEFVIPLNAESLLKTSGNSYFVEELVDLSEFSSQELKSNLQSKNLPPLKIQKTLKNH